MSVVETPGMETIVLSWAEVREAAAARSSIVDEKRAIFAEVELRMCE